MNKFENPHKEKLLWTNVWNTKMTHLTINISLWCLLAGLVFSQEPRYSGYLAQIDGLYQPIGGVKCTLEQFHTACSGPERGRCKINIEADTYFCHCYRTWNGRNCENPWNPCTDNSCLTENTVKCVHPGYNLHFNFTRWFFIYNFTIENSVPCHHLHFTVCYF